MDAIVPLSDATRFTAGVLLVSIVAVELGGVVLVRIVRGREPATPFQLAFSRAGHAHAGVLVILALISQIYVDAVPIDGPISTIARTGVAAAAILMSAGFFLSSAGSGRTEPNGLIALVWIGGVSLAAGVVALGANLLSST